MSQSTRVGPFDRAYRTIFNEQDTPLCEDISEEACRYVPRNLFLIALSQTLTRLGDQLTNAKTVLAWLLGFVGAPAAFVALLVPVRESGSMLPQVFIAGYLRRLSRRKGVWILGSLLQAVAIIGMGAATAFTRGAVAGWSILGLLALFSLARAPCSVASKDVMGKTIPKRRRGRLDGFSAAVSGTAAVLLGAFIWSADTDAGTPRFYMFLLVGAGVLFVIAGAVYAMIREFPGETQHDMNPVTGAVRRLDLLRTDKAFRRFVITRALLLCSALSGPYYVMLAQQRHGIDLKALGSFILANALASSLSSLFWGAMADRSSKRVLVRASLLAATLGIAVFIIDKLDTPLSHASWVYPAAFFILGVAHSGVRTGRKTYVVDMAGGNRRTDYVSVGNTVIGLILLLTGLLAPLVPLISPAGVILLLSLFGLTGAALGTTLPEVEE